MASSGTITINAQSVDAASSKQAACFPGITSGCCYGDCNPLLYGRGIVSADITLNWAVNDSGLLSFSWNSYSGSTWYVCSVNGYHIDIDWSTDGTNWSTISSSFLNNWPTCSADWNHTVNNISQQLIAGLPAVTLTQSGYIRARMWTQNACPTCGIGDDSWPNAFPNDAASKTTTVPVHIDVSWTAQLKYAGQGSGLPSAQSATETGNSHNFTVSSTIPTRSNYRFDGWATVGGGTPTYHGGDTYTVYKDSPTKYLYACWTAYWTATVHYDANGGTGAPADQTASVNPDYNTKTFTVSNTVPTRTNYRFEGWSYGGNTYHGGDTVTVPANAPTANLVAIWTEFYRPGERRVSGTWSSHNRSGGACERKVSGTWTEMRTIDGGTGTGDEPTRKQSGTWYNQRKCGQE